MTDARVQLDRDLWVRDRAAAASSFAAILAWDFDRVVVTHGDVLKTGGHDAVAAAFAYLGGG